MTHLCYRLFSRFERAVFDPAAENRILLITPQQKVSFQRYYGTPDERFELLPPGVSPDRRPGPDRAGVRSALREEFGVSEAELLLLFVGSGFITKGLDRALEAMAALPAPLRERTVFFVIGHDNPSRFMNLAESLGIVGRVTFFPGRDDVPRFFQGADLLVHPAYMESGGIVLLEAAIAGLPAITTDVCGFAPYLESAGAGQVLASPFRQTELNDALRRALEDPQQRRRWSAAGLEFGRHADIYDMPERAAGIIEERIGAPALPA